MIDCFSENDFKLENEHTFVQWLSEVISQEGCEEGEISFVFCDDPYLLALNQEFLNHDTLTDIITFDNSLGKQLHGEIYISTERVRENAEIFAVPFLEELSRVLVHGILHLCGYKDKTEDQEKEMRGKENYYLSKIGGLSN